MLEVPPSPTRFGSLLLHQETLSSWLHEFTRRVLSLTERGQILELGLILLFEDYPQ